MCLLNGGQFVQGEMSWTNFIGNKNKANLRDLIAAICLVILLKLDSNRRFFSPCNLELDGWPLLCYIKLCASFQIHRWIQTWFTVWKHSIRVKIGDFLSRVILKLMNDLGKQHGTSSILHQTLCIILKPSVISITLKAIGHLFYSTSSFVHHFKATAEFKLQLQSGSAQFRSISAIFCPVWPRNLMDDHEKQ